MPRQASLALSLYFSGILPHNTVAVSQPHKPKTHCQHQPTLSDEEPTPSPVSDAAELFTSNTNDSQSQWGIQSLATTLASAHMPESLLRRASVSSCSSVILQTSSLANELRTVASRVSSAVKRRAWTLLKEIIRRPAQWMMDIKPPRKFVPSAEVLAAPNVDGTISIVLLCN